MDTPRIFPATPELYLARAYERMAWVESDVRMIPSLPLQFIKETLMEEIFEYLEMAERWTLQAGELLRGA